MKVFDKDLVGSDDLMGQSEFDLTCCEISKSKEVTLHLDDGEMRIWSGLIINSMNPPKLNFPKEKQEKENTWLHNCETYVVPLD